MCCEVSTVLVRAWQHQDGPCNSCNPDADGVTLNAMVTIRVGSMLFRLCQRHWRVLRDKVGEYDW